jgi:hypothetical protein
VRLRTAFAFASASVLAVVAYGCSSDDSRTSSANGGASDGGGADGTSGVPPPHDSDGTSDGASSDAPNDGAPVDAGPPNVMFVTSSIYSGNLGGRSGADGICMAHAADAGLPGTFRAFLGGSWEAEAGPLLTYSARGWVRTDGKPFLDTIDAAFAPTEQEFNTPSLDEHGRTFSTIVWTGLSVNGPSVNPQHASCLDWTDGVNDDNFGGYGVSTEDAGGWIGSPGGMGCAGTGALYCMQIDHDVPVNP